MIIHKVLDNFGAGMNLEDNDGESNFSNDSNSSEPEMGNVGNSAWADAMCKVLNTNTSNKSNFILSKAIKDRDVKEERKDEIEIIDESGNVIKSAEPKSKANLNRQSFKQKRKEMIKKQKQKSEWETMCRVKPDIIQKEKERELIRIATRGIVHLFNTVQKHQKVVKNPKERNAAKKENPGVVKENFMSILKGHSKRELTSENDPVAKKIKEEETWNILKDDFMMGAEMKDWDKESDNE